MTEANKKTTKTILYILLFFGLIVAGTLLFEGTVGVQIISGIVLLVLVYLAIFKSPIGALIRKIFNK